MRVVAHSCSNTEIVCALGCADLLVGVDVHSDYPPEAVRGLPRVGPDLNLDPHLVEALRPDLVLYSLTIPGHETAFEKLRERGIPTVALEPVSLADIYRNILTIGDALSVPARAEALVAAMKAEIIPIEVRYRPKVLVEWWPKPVIVPGRRSWVTDLVEAAGGRNPFAERDVKSTPITPKEARAAAPDAVAIAWCGVPVRKYRPSVVAGRYGWQGIPAVQAGRIAPISEEYLGRPGPRIVEGYRALRRLVESCPEPG